MPDEKNEPRIEEYLDQKLGSIERWHSTAPPDHQMLNAIRLAKAELKSWVIDIVRIPVIFKQREIRLELRSHLKESLQDEMDAGASLEEAWERSRKVFGDVDQHLRDLEHVHRIQIYQWLTRLATFGVLLLLMNAFSLHWRAFFYLPLLLVIFIAGTCIDYGLGLARKNASAPLASRRGTAHNNLPSDSRHVGFDSPFRNPCIFHFACSVHFILFSRAGPRIALHVPNRNGLNNNKTT